MASLNKVMLIGNLTKDPEVRYTGTGTAVADLRLAVTRRYKTSSGQEQEETCFVTVTVWGRQAETCGEYLRKGSPAFVEGRLKLDTWEKDGQKNSRLTVVAERVQFLSAPRRADYGDAPEGGSGGGGRRRAPASAPSAPEPSVADDGGGDAGGGEPPAGDNDDLPF